MALPPILNVTRSLRDARWLNVTIGTPGQAQIVGGSEARQLQRHAEREGLTVQTIDGLDDKDLRAGGVRR